MSVDLTVWSWPLPRLGEALTLLASGGRGPSGSVDQGTYAPGSPEDIAPWIETFAARLGLEAEAVETPVADVQGFLLRVGPALLRLPDGGEPRFLVLLGRAHHRVVLLSPDRLPVRLHVDEVRDALCHDAERPFAEQLQRTLKAISVPESRWRGARRVLLRELLVEQRVGGWLLRPAPGAALLTQAGAASLPLWLLTLTIAQVAESSLWVVSWWLLGWMSVHGRFDFGWLLAWLLTLLTLVPCRLLKTFAEGMVSIRGGALLKQRLLSGALRMNPDDVRHAGVGELMGCVLESEAVESLALTGGFLALTSLIELLLAGVVLGLGAGRWLHVILLALAVAGAFGLAGLYLRQRRRWTRERLTLTHDLVERMLGHRTRLAQQPQAEWHAGEDQALDHYLATSVRLDRAGMLLQVLVPRGWLLLGLLGLAPAFLFHGRASGTTTLAVGIGGVVLAYHAFRHLADGLERLMAAVVAWERIQPFWVAASRSEALGDLHVVGAGRAGSRLAPRRDAASRSEATTLDVHELVFRYNDRSPPVLQGVSLAIDRGDRLLLEGTSGGGKSTLAALLAGGREPSSGLLLLGGLDWATLGASAWRRRVVLAPQFHDNHVLMGTFAYNLLLGRGWPPTPSDLEEAERICRGLDLGPLLERMPAGLQQLVGETGWQLSHGERSRLYIARALLQRADVLLLDESFAALDPQTLRHTLAFVLEEAPTVLVIAHP